MQDSDVEFTRSAGKLISPKGQCTFGTHFSNDTMSMILTVIYKIFFPVIQVRNSTSILRDFLSLVIKTTLTLKAYNTLEVGIEFESRSQSRLNNIISTGSSRHF